MINKYKYIVYVLFVSIFALGYGQSIQELQKLKGDYEKFQKGQKQLQLPTGVDPGVDPLTGLPKEAKLILCKQKSPHAYLDPDRALVNYNVIDGDVLILKEVLEK